MQTTNHRMQYWDVAKGMTILLVIMGHLPQLPVQLTQAIYTFHMPFFFVANAFFIKHYDIKVHVKKNFKSLLVPYMIVCVLEAICYALRGNTDVYYDYDILRVNGEIISGSAMTFPDIFWDKIADMFVGISFTSSGFKAFESVWIVWFLAVLFVTKLMYIGIMKIISLKVSSACRWVELMILVVLAPIGMRIGQNYAFLPWSFDVAMVCLPFMWFGEFLGKSKVLEHKNAKLIYAFSLVIWVVLSSMGYGGELALRVYPGDFMWMINATCGTVVMIGVAKALLYKKNVIADFFSWCGRNSIVILGIHCLEHRFFDWNHWVYEKIEVNLHWIALVMIHVIAIVCSAWVVVECRRRVRLWYEKKSATM